ncbi:MAG: TetR/AcrR family transcriptional regulator [Firmicutes bacterium]|nr:TetR/AcrR family transcriptional regulator [Bacillota bacterium]
MDYRQRITAAFKELAVAKGISRVTVDELAERTGISKRTIYRYFNSKEEIIVSVLEDFMSAMSQKVDQALATSTDPLEKILNVIKVIPDNVSLFFPLVLHDLQKHYPHLWEKVERFRAGRAEHIIERIINDETGRFKKINPKVFTTSLLAGIRAVLNPVFIMENNLTLEEAVQALFTIFLHGIVEHKAS